MESNKYVDSFIESMFYHKQFLRCFSLLSVILLEFLPRDSWCHIRYVEVVDESFSAECSMARCLIISLVHFLV